MNIDINIPSARAANNQLPAIINHFDAVKSILANSVLNIDHRVLSRSNLRARLRAAHDDVESAESDLPRLHSMITQNINAYEENERQLLAMVRNAPVSL